MPNYRIQYRRDTAENWQTVNPILLDGEVGYEITDQEGVLLQKVGDGVMGADGTITGTHWNDLPYVSGPIGPAPEHEWQETSLRFRKPNGVWGDYVNLQGPQGIQGIQGVQGEPGTAIPATATSLGGIIVGDNLKINSEGCLSVPPMLYNKQETIVASGSWVAPQSSWYAVTIINGGSGGRTNTTSPTANAYGGNGGAYETFLVFLEENQEVPVTIGAGGVGRINNTTVDNGGISYFGNLTPDLHRSFPVSPQRGDANIGFTRNSFGSGLGGGQDGGNATWYGGGGGAYIATTRETGAITTNKAGKGGNGAIIIRYYDSSLQNGNQQEDEGE